MRVALITNIPSPYRLPVWDDLGRKVDCLHVFLCSKTEPNRIWQTQPLDQYSFKHTRLPGLHLFIQGLDWGIHFNPALWRAVERYQPSHILLGSYESPSYLLALLYAKLKKIPVTLWWESHALSSRVQGGPILWLKKQLLRRVNSFCAVSSLAKEYLTDRLGIPEDRIMRAVNTVDVQRWHELVARHRQGRNGSEQPVRFLYVGQFIARKGLIQLLRAFERIPAEKGILRLVGYGPQQAEIEALIAEHHLKHVEIVGPTKTMEETARYYSWADVLVMPSLSEVWGLVVNEALACGVYVMASTYAGVTHDLIELAPYDVGISFDPLQQESFVAALLAVIEKCPTIDRREISAWGLKQTPEIYAQSLFDALLIAGPSKQIS